MVAKNFQVVLDGDREANTESSVWDQGAFGASQTTLQSLVEAAKRSDFAVLVFSADDKVQSRKEVGKAPRDNVVFELGLFMGVIGTERVFILPAKGVKLPTDLGGFTLLPAYVERQDSNVQASLTGGMLAAVAQIKRLGPRQAVESSAPKTTQRLAGQTAAERRAAERSPQGRGSLRVVVPGQDEKRLDDEIELICRAATAQGWQIKTRTREVLRLVDRNKRKHTVPLSDSPKAARRELRPFARMLRANGLRVSSRVRADP